MVNVSARNPVYPDNGIPKLRRVVLCALTADQYPVCHYSSRPRSLFQRSIENKYKNYNKNTFYSFWCRKNGVFMEKWSLPKPGTSLMKIMGFGTAPFNRTFGIHHFWQWTTRKKQNKECRTFQNVQWLYYRFVSFYCFSFSKKYNVLINFIHWMFCFFVKSTPLPISSLIITFSLFKLPKLLLIIESWSYFYIIWRHVNNK